MQGITWTLTTEDPRIIASASLLLGAAQGQLTVQYGKEAFETTFEVEEPRRWVVIQLTDTGPVPATVPMSLLDATLTRRTYAEENPDEKFWVEEAQ